MRFSCQFYEVSAAESCAGAALAFHALLREARALALLLPPRRKLAAYSVSKVSFDKFVKALSHILNMLTTRHHKYIAVVHCTVQCNPIKG